MLTFTDSKKYLVATLFLFFSFISTSDALANSDQQQKGQAKAGFVPPPIPQVNTPDFKDYVRNNHTFPSPFGYEAYKDKEGKDISYLLSELNPANPYIPITLYCNSVPCPSVISYTHDRVTFNYSDRENISFDLKGSRFNNPAMLGFYFPKDPRLYRLVGFHMVDRNTRKGAPLVTILFSQRLLQNLSEMNNGKRNGYFAAKPKNKSVTGTDIDLPLADGKETLNVGTTLSVIGLGEASGVEFTETVTQTTGETFTQQVQTGFSLNVALENEFSLGGGIIPADTRIKFAINSTLSQLISNGLQIANERSISRTYTIKPGIDDTYYWAIYQLLYSYRIHAPQLEAVFKRIQSIWNNQITFKIANNEETQDGKLIGNTLPPQAANIPNDITVGVAVPMYSAENKNVFYQLLK